MTGRVVVPDDHWEVAVEANEGEALMGDRRRLARDDSQRMAALGQLSHDGGHVVVASREAVVMLVLPLLLLFVFDRSERATREWMGAGMDLDIEVLQLVASEHFTLTRFGQYLQELRSRFPGVVVADMYCLLRLELELSVHARALIMAREAGLELAGDEDLDASFDEREYLQRSIGKVGLIALRPLQVTSDRDRWHRQLLAQSRKRT